MFGLTLWQILIVVAIGFLVFGVGGTKKLLRRTGNRIKQTGQSVKGAAGELQANYNSEADSDSAMYRAASSGREKVTEGAALALDVAKEAREEIASIADDARGTVGGAEPQTAVGRAARAVTDSARDVRAGVVGDDGGEEYQPQTALGKAAKSASETAKARVDMLSETASEFRAGIEGVPAAETAAATETPALPAVEEPAPPATPGQS